uniref:Uncharacterized protein n=1 Tax=Onchocerca volvulus TaxID=6282 RepID=A0A8R1TML6_ONCVO
MAFCIFVTTKKYEEKKQHTQTCINTYVNIQAQTHQHEYKHNSNVLFKYVEKKKFEMHFIRYEHHHYRNSQPNLLRQYYTLVNNSRPSIPDLLNIHQSMPKNGTIDVHHSNHSANI